MGGCNREKVKEKGKGNREMVKGMAGFILNCTFRIMQPANKKNGYENLYENR